MDNILNTSNICVCVQERSQNFELREVALLLALLLAECGGFNLRLCYLAIELREAALLLAECGDFNLWFCFLVVENFFFFCVGKNKIIFV